MKLKEILSNTVVHTPTEEEAKELLSILHENGYVWIDFARLIATTKWSTYEAETCYKIRAKKYVTYSTKSWFEHDGATILTLSEFKEQYVEEEKPQPKFKVGDIIKVVGYQENCASSMKKHLYEVGTVRGVLKDEGGFYYTITSDKEYFSWREDWLKPYPEAMETKEEKSENPINLCELLNGHEDEDKLKNIWIKIQKEDLSSKMVINLDDSQYCLNFQENEVKVELLVGHSFVNVNVETLKK